MNDAVGGTSHPTMTSGVSIAVNPAAAISTDAAEQSLPTPSASPVVNTEDSIASPTTLDAPPDRTDSASSAGRLGSTASAVDRELDAERTLAVEAARAAAAASKREAPYPQCTPMLSFFLFLKDQKSTAAKLARMLDDITSKRVDGWDERVSDALCLESKMRSCQYIFADPVANSDGTLTPSAVFHQSSITPRCTLSETTTSLWRKQRSRSREDVSICSP